MLLNISVQDKFDGDKMSIIFKRDQNRNKEFEGYTLSGQSVYVYIVLGLL